MHVPRTLRPRLLAFSVKGGPLAMVAVALVASAAWPRAATAQATGTAKTFFDYIQPTPIVCSPLTSNTWGTTGPCPSDDSPAYVTPGCDAPRTPATGWRPRSALASTQNITTGTARSSRTPRTAFGTVRRPVGQLRWIQCLGDLPTPSRLGWQLAVWERTDTGVAYTNGPSGSTGHNSSVSPSTTAYGLVASEVIPFTVWTATSSTGPGLSAPTPAVSCSPIRTTSAIVTTATRTRT